MIRAAERAKGRSDEMSGEMNCDSRWSQGARCVGAVLAAFALVFCLGTATAFAAVGPAFETYTTWGDTNVVPGSDAQIAVHVHNVGDESPSDAVVVKAKVPSQMTVQKVVWSLGTEQPDFAEFLCTTTAHEISCEIPSFFAAFFLSAPGPTAGFIQAGPTGWAMPFYINVAVDPSASGAEPVTVTVEGGGASSPATETVNIPFGGAPAHFGLAPDSFEADVFEGPIPFRDRARQAGDHPFEQRVDFELTKKTGVDPQDGTRYVVANGLVKTIEVTLPRGLIGNPEAVPKCDPKDFALGGAVFNSTSCPANTQVGYLNIHATEATKNYGRGVGVFGAFPDGILQRVALYNLQPPRGVPADFGFHAGGFVLGHIYPELDPAQDYAIRTVTPNISALVQPTGSEVVFWGVPGDPAHDKFRYYGEPKNQGEDALGAPFEGAIRPLLTNPMDCGFDNGGVRFRADSYNQPGDFSPVQEEEEALNVTGCGDPRIRFKPQIAMQPDNRDAGGPTGLDVHLEVPQREDVVAKADDLYARNGEIAGISTPPLKKAVVTFPEGMTLSPSAAQGLGTCTAAQIGLGTNDPVTCPDNSQYGKLVLHTPILPKTAQPEGFIYIAKQGDNPFHNFLSLYLVIQEPERGILIKIPGRLDLDSMTGRITATFDDLPQFPVSDMQMTFKGGVRAGLVNPTTCGTKTIRAEMFSWADPSTPRVVDSSYEVTRKPDGSPCVQGLAERQFKPQMDAGTVSPSAGSFSPFVFNLARGDADQEFSQVAVTLPQGLAARFAGVAMCSESGIAQALSRETTAGAAALEEANPSCPASSQIGTTEVGAGVGVPLTYVPGKVYLAGPYKGAPLSMVVISPAQIGPYDLGVIAVRTALKVDPITAQGSAVSDPFPQIFQGIPVRIRDIRLNLDRPNFTFNPTSCAEKQIVARVTGTGGDLPSTADDTGVNLSNRFQAADCASLGFKPRLTFRLFGGTKRGAHPKLKAVLKARPGDANLASTSVALPHSEFLDQAHIKTVCTRVQFAANACPPGSVYGYAVAETPIFDQPLRGPVYLRSSDNPLPNLVAALQGPDSQPVKIVLDGRIDSVRGGIRNSFDLIPDAPVSSFTLTMQGGKKGLLVNSTNLCAKTNRATVQFRGQNGKVLTTRPAIRNACGKGAKRRHKH